MIAYLVTGHWFLVLRRLAVVCFLAIPAFVGSTVRADDALLERWLTAQSQIKTWSANLTQTRTLKALKDPLKAVGRVWFSAPNRFRWELGNPAQTIAVREPTALIILYPKLKRAERYSLEDQKAGQWRDALTLLETGFPRSREQLERQFNIVSIKEGDDEIELNLQPRSAGARKLISQVRLVFGRDDLLLLATELRFADGSTLRNDFTDSKINPSLDKSLFEVSIPDDFKLTEPLSGAR